MDCTPLPFRLTVPVPDVKVPDALVQLPAMASVFELARIVPVLIRFPLTVNELFMVRVAPVLMVISLQKAAAPITGWFGPADMVTFVAEVGCPPHQFASSFQFVSLYPNHVPVVQLGTDIFKVPEDPAM